VGAAEALGGGQQDVLGSAVGVRENLGIPQADDAPSLRTEIVRPPCVGICGRDMLAAIDFDRQPRLSAHQIDEERCFYELAREGGSMARDAMPDR
jgi:hypothetical protein